MSASIVYLWKKNFDAEIAWPYIHRLDVRRMIISRGRFKIYKGLMDIDERTFMFDMWERICGNIRDKEGFTGHYNLGMLCTNQRLP